MGYYTSIEKANLKAPEGEDFYSLAGKVIAMGVESRDVKFTFNERLTDLIGMTEIDRGYLQEEQCKMFGYGWIENVLEKLSELGVTGSIHYTGEEAEHYLLTLNGDGTTTLKKGRIVFE